MNGVGQGQSSGPTQSKRMSTGMKIGLGCGGCFLLVVFGLIFMAFMAAVGGKAPHEGTRADRGSISGAIEPSPSTPITISARDLFQAFQANDAAALDQFRGKYVAVEGQVSDTNAIVRSIKNGVDPDNILNLDLLVAVVPSDSDIEKAAGVYGIPSEQMRGTFPSIGLELSGDSRRPSGGGDAPGMGPWGDILFVFDTRPEGLKKLKIGKRVRIVGRVDGWLKRSVLVKDCQVMAD